MILTDSHAHLLDPSFEKDLENVMERAKTCKIRFINNCIDSTDKNEIEKGLELAKKYENILLSVGVHPFDAKNRKEEIASILIPLSSDKLVAIGEIGIDSTYDVSIEEQKEVFRKQLEIAKRKKLPVVIHCRHSFKEIYEIIMEEKFLLGGVLHAFSGKWDEAKKFLDIGFYISFSGVLTYSKKAKDVATKVPLERILVETDSPYLTPLPYKGQRNEPSFIVKTIEELSRLKGCSIEESAEVTTNNFISLFLNGKNKNGIKENL